VKPLHFEAKTGKYCLLLKTDPLPSWASIAIAARSRVTPSPGLGDIKSKYSTMLVIAALVRKPFLGDAVPCFLLLRRARERARPALTFRCRYSCTANAGDFIVEDPGTIHTLYMGAGSGIVFTVFGSIEFFNDDGTL
jgi:hypothetical protein